MRGQPLDHTLTNEATLSGALGAVAAGKTPFAGGTDLMVMFEAGKLKPGAYFSLHEVRELAGIHETVHALELGALVTYTELRRYPGLASEFPMLVDAAKMTGAAAIQSRGTIGGNIANASPAADTPPALIAYDAAIELTSAARGARWLPYRTFHTGYKTTQRAPDELITKVRLPRIDRTRQHYYRKVGPRLAQAISKVCFAAVATLDDGKISAVRVGLGSVGPVVVDASDVASILLGQAPDAALADAAAVWLGTLVKPIDDIRSTGAYRLRVAQNLMRDFVLSLAVPTA